MRRVSVWNCMTTSRVLEKFKFFESHSSSLLDLLRRHIQTSIISHWIQLISLKSALYSKKHFLINYTVTHCLFFQSQLMPWMFFYDKNKNVCFLFAHPINKKIQQKLTKPARHWFCCAILSIELSFYVLLHISWFIQKLWTFLILNEYYRIYDSTILIVIIITSNVLAHYKHFKFIRRRFTYVRSLAIPSMLHCNNIFCLRYSSIIS